MMADVLMPQLGETVTEGTISVWFKSVGDTVSSGDNLFEIETDKVAMEVPALQAGILAEILVNEGESGSVGMVVARIEAEGTKERAAVGASGRSTKRNRASTSDGLSLFHEVVTPTRNFGPVSLPNGVKATPLARRLMAEKGIDPLRLAEAVAKKGGRRVARADVESFLDAPQPAARRDAREPVSHPGTADGRLVPMNRIRARTAELLSRAWRDVPHVLQAVEADFSRVEKARRSHNASGRGSKLSYLPFVARGVCLAIRDFPHVNATLEKGGLRLHDHVHLGIAVDLAHEGLLVPVIRNAEGYNLSGLADAIQAATEKARSGRLVPDDLGGGTYTLSNSGTFGTLITAPIVNPPEVAILSTDGVRKKPVVVGGEDGDMIAIRPVGVLAQSFDHRAFDGAYSAAFLHRLREIIETRDWMAEIA